MSNVLVEIVKSILTKKEATLDAEQINWEELIKFARINGLIQYVALYADSLSKDKKPDDKISAYLSNLLIQEIARSSRQLYVAKQLQEMMEQNGVDTLILKGVCTKRRYESDILRSMSDIDILYKPGQHSLFKKTMESLKFDDYKEGRKNDFYTLSPFVLVEAHRQLVESGSAYLEYYSDIWEKAELVPECRYTYELSIEDEFVFNIVHLAEHFREGGAGIRFIMDVYVYSQLDMDTDYVKTELEKLSLYEFYLNIKSLCDYWFSDKDSTLLVLKLEEFILKSGVFGDRENTAALSVKDGRFKGLIKSFFPNYESMKSMFVWMDNRPYLLPVAWVVRATKAAIFRKNNVKKSLRKIYTGDIDTGKALEKLYKECGL